MSQLDDDAWDLMRLDARVAELVHDTLIDDASAMRSVGVVDRTLVFRGQGVDIDVIIDPTGSLIGQLSPVAAGSGIVITVVAQHSIEVDANGRFVADPLPGRRFRLVIRTAVATVITAWQPISR